MKMEPGDLLVWRHKENAFRNHGMYALVLEVSGLEVICDFYPSGIRQTNTVSTMKFWYKKFDGIKKKE